MSGNRFAEENRFLGGRFDVLHERQGAHDELHGSVAIVLRQLLEPHRFEIIGEETTRLRARAEKLTSKRPSMEGVLQTLMYPERAFIAAIDAGAFLWEMRRLVMGLGLSPDQQEGILQARANTMAQSAVCALLDTLGHFGYSPNDARHGGKPTDQHLLPDIPVANGRFRTQLRERDMSEEDILMVEEAFRLVKFALPEDRTLPDSVAALL